MNELAPLLRLVLGLAAFVTFLVMTGFQDNKQRDTGHSSALIRVIALLIGLPGAWALASSLQFEEPAPLIIVGLLGYAGYRLYSCIVSPPQPSRSDRTE